MKKDTIKFVQYRNIVTLYKKDDIFYLLFTIYKNNKGCYNLVTRKQNRIKMKVERK